MLHSPETVIYTKLFLPNFIGFFILSFVIAKLTKWSFLRSFIVTSASKLISWPLYTLFITLPIVFLHMSKIGASMTVGLTLVSKISSIFLEPLVHIAALRTISELYLSRDKEYNFGRKAYLILVLFRFGMLIFNFLWLYFESLITLS